MRVSGKNFRTVWLEADNAVVKIIDQRKIPHIFSVEELRSVEEVATAIRDMHVRGAPAIGVSAAYGMYLAIYNNQSNFDFRKVAQEAALLLKATRPTAVNLAWAVEQQLDVIKNSTSLPQALENACRMAQKIAEDDLHNCKQIGLHGVKIIEEISRKKNNKPVNILTHCNAGWLACVDYGTATAPIYEAHKRGVPVHVWVSETRPRNQGASLTAWELMHEEVPHTVIVDNTAGILMQRGMVDLVIVGSDRTTHTGDVANKIGTYLKAVAANANAVPFYAALPSSTIDWEIRDGVADIPIEERSSDEVCFVQGWGENSIQRVQVTPQNSEALNFAFDVTPRSLVTGLITERGVCRADEAEIRKLFPEK